MRFPVRFRPAAALAPAEKEGAPLVKAAAESPVLETASRRIPLFLEPGTGRRIRIVVLSDGRVRVFVPRGVGPDRALAFAREKGRLDRALGAERRGPRPPPSPRRLRRHGPDLDSRPSLPGEDRAGPRAPSRVRGGALLVPCFGPGRRGGRPEENRGLAQAAGRAGLRRVPAPGPGNGGSPRRRRPALVPALDETPLGELQPGWAPGLQYPLGPGASASRRVRRSARALSPEAPRPRRVVPLASGPLSAGLEGAAQGAPGHRRGWTAGGNYFPSVFMTSSTIRPIRASVSPLGGSEAGVPVRSRGQSHDPSRRHGP